MQYLIILGVCVVLLIGTGFYLSQQNYKHIKEQGGDTEWIWEHIKNKIDDNEKF